MLVTWASLCVRLACFPRKATSAFLSRCGLAIGKAGSGVAGGASLADERRSALLGDLAVAESKLREFLAKHGAASLPPDRVHPEPAPVVGAKPQKPHPGGRSSAVVAPLQVRDGRVLETVSTVAHDLGVGVGGSVLFQEKAYTVDSIAQDVMVIKHEATSKTLTVEDVKTLALPKEAKKEKVPPLGPDKRMPGELWALADVAAAESALMHWLHLAMFHIHTTSCPGPDLLRVHHEPDVGQRLSLEVPAKERSLVLIPYALHYEPADPDKPRPQKAAKQDATASHVLIKYQLKGSSAATYVKAKSKGCATPFWKLLGDISHQPNGPTTLTWSTATVDVPLKGSLRDKTKSNLTRASTTKTLQVIFPYLTNTSDLPARAVLTAPRGAPPSVL